MDPPQVCLSGSPGWLLFAKGYLCFPASHCVSYHFGLNYLRGYQLFHHSWPILASQWCCLMFVCTHFFLLLLVGAVFYHRAVFSACDMHSRAVCCSIDRIGLYHDCRSKFYCHFTLAFSMPPHRSKRTDITPSFCTPAQHGQSCCAQCATCTVVLCAAP